MFIYYGDKFRGGIKLVISSRFGYWALVLYDLNIHWIFTQSIDRTGIPILSFFEKYNVEKKSEAIVLQIHRVLQIHILIVMTSKQMLEILTICGQITPSQSFVFYFFYQLFTADGTTDCIIVIFQHLACCFTIQTNKYIYILN